MIIKIVAVCLAFLAGAAYCQNSTTAILTGLYCKRIKAQDCNNFNVTEICGTNQVTYKNGCELGQAYCADDHIHQAHNGPCNGDPNATRSPEEVQHGSAVILDFECIYLSHLSCQPAANEHVCGSNGKTYSTFCEYQKGRCTHRDLHVAHLGVCTV